MESEKTKKNKPEIEFKNCETLGNQVKALVIYFTGASAGSWVLEQALEEVKQNKKKIEDFTKRLVK